MGQSAGGGALDLGGRSFDHYARLVRRFVGVPVSLVSLVEDQRQVFAGAVGLAEPWQSERQTPLTHSFCQYVVQDGAPLVVTDARSDARLADNLAIDALGVVAYAGWPLTDATGRTVGSLCAIDPEPREWTADDLAALEDLALACSAEIQHAVAQAEASHQLARSMVDAADVAMLLFDEQERLVLANGRAETIAAAAGLPLDAPPYAGAEVWRADRQAPVPAADQVLPRALRGERLPQEIEWFGPSGDQVAVVATAQRLADATGGSWHTLVVMHDVTELAMAQEIRERVSATVTHELRTPLTAILGYLELLGEHIDPDDPGNEGAVRSLERIRRSAETLAERIARVLDTSQRRRHHGLRATDVTALVQRVLESFGPAATGTEPRVALRPGEHEWASVDAARVEQAVENLVGNALKYSAPETAVDVVVSGTADAVEVVVADAGAGMTPEEVERAFEAYWRSDGARDSTADGVGLGLPLVREIATEHHGTVHLTSTPGRGTTVTLRLPRVAI